MGRKMDASSSPSRSGNSGYRSRSLKLLDAEWKNEEEEVIRTTTKGGGGSGNGINITAWEGESGVRRERKPTKLLLNVNVQNGLGPVQVVMSTEKTVEDLIKAVMELYVKEKRRPLLPSTEPHFFELHYSPFVLEGIMAEEKLENLESRNFFLCLKPTISSHFDQAKTLPKSPFPMPKFTDYLL